MKQHGVESAVEPVRNSRARREQLQEKGERLGRTAEVRRVRDGEKRRGYLLHQRLDRVCVDVGKRPVDAGEESGDDSGVDAGAVHVTPNGVTCLGYTNMNSRAAEISSLLWSGNMTKLLLSMENKEDGSYHVNTETDEAVRSMCVVDGGKKLEPYVPPPPPPPTEAQLAAAAEAEAAAVPPNP